MHSNQIMHNVPGRIVAFYPDTQTADVQVCAELVFSDSDEISQQVLSKPIKGIPVHINSGGGWSQTHPITAGNTCQITFSQVGYDHWLYNDEDAAGTLDEAPKPWLRRKFSRNDGFCIVGYNTIPLAIANYSAVNSEWRNVAGDQIIRLLPNDDIEVETTTKIKLIAEVVDVDCTTATVDAATSVTVTTPLLEIISTTAVNITTPLLTLTGNLTMTGLLNVAMGIGAGGAVAPSTGMLITGPANMNGALTVVGALSAATIDSASQSLDGHIHDGDSGGSTSTPT